jgi:hypothetical protein
LLKKSDKKEVGMSATGFLVYFSCHCSSILRLMDKAFGALLNMGTMHLSSQVPVLSEYIFMPRGIANVQRGVKT